MRKRIAVVGGGAVGGYIAAHLAAAKHDVRVMDTLPVATSKAANGVDVPCRL